MEFKVFSYRFAKEILEHPDYFGAWSDLVESIKNAPLFIYPGKSIKNSRLDVVQQLMNTYFDRALTIDRGWEYHPLATGIEDSKLAADFKKSFGPEGRVLPVQAEIQFGNMARWYSDIFKFQAAYSHKLVKVGASVVPMAAMSRRIDSNVVQFERAKRELPAAELSITLPIVMFGLYEGDNTKIVDVSKSQFESIGEITGKKKAENRWRLVNAFMNEVPMEDIGPHSETGPMIVAVHEEEDDDS